MYTVLQNKTLIVQDSTFIDTFAVVEHPPNVTAAILIYSLTSLFFFFNSLLKLKEKKMQPCRHVTEKALTLETP